MTAGCLGSVLLTTATSVAVFSLGAFLEGLGRAVVESPGNR